MLASPVRSISFAIRTAGVIRLKFFLCHSNGSHHSFEIFPVLFKHLQHPFKILTWPFERYLKPFSMAGTSICHLFVKRSPAVHFDR